MSEELAAYNFPQYPPEPLVKRAPRLDQDGLDLVEHFLHYEAKKRISARNAMRHPYFGPSLGPAAIENLLDGKLFLIPLAIFESLCLCLFDLITNELLIFQFNPYLHYREFICLRTLVIDHQLLTTLQAENREGKACYCDLEKTR